MARPTKYSPETVKKVCDYLRTSNTRRPAGRLSGISEDTFGRWLVTYPDFSEAVEKAETESEVHLIGLLVKSAAKTPQSAQWLLSRRRPNDWGAKVEQPTPAPVDNAQLSNDDRLKRIEQLLAAAADRSAARLSGT